MTLRPSSGIAPEVDEIDSYAKRLGIEFEQPSAPLRYLQSSGYVRATLGEAMLFADVGRIGPDYLPGHAHADSLGFELSLFGHRWFVDSGCSTYEVSEERLRQRGTAAHNTVVVDGEDSSEVWSSFRVARRARPLYAKATFDGNAILIDGAHDGYRRLPGKVTHARSFNLDARRLQLTDTLEGKFSSAEANFLLHPDIEIREIDVGFVLDRNGREVTLFFEGGTPRVHPSSWHPEFGKAIPTHRITVTFTGSKMTTTIRWSS